ncbi:hypothetical protein HBH98_188910 [Parastagonospora nodorum]|nr:hypothetical protein HBH51_157520 [Parastagonospora nodorum]KAH4093315.1 hypothetical protein HBH46_180000 [Parastagonospora nodorum]KAH4159795.1 hypothetical protein HBH43_184430 [Parastagonospora nodorum]KAH4209820.1 hypothetical protein HBI95_081250 [Parastagonospora nodorum]KAH4301719.1 hypothetical protein HBI01_095720 [Parastagonospora nodorum]
MIVMLGSLLALVSGDCKPKPAPDEIFDIFYKPSDKWDLDTSTGTHGCEIAVPFDKPRIHPCPGNNGFNVWNFNAYNPDNFNETIAWSYLLGVGNAYPFQGGTAGFIWVNVEISFANGFWLRAKMENGRPPGETGHANISTSGAGSTARWGIIPLGWNSTKNGEIHTHREEHGKYQLGLTGTMDMKAVNTWGERSSMPKPNPRERVYVERDGKLQARDMISGRKCLCHQSSTSQSDIS